MNLHPPRVNACLAMICAFVFRFAVVLSPPAVFGIHFTLFVKKLSYDHDGM